MSGTGGESDPGGPDGANDGYSGRITGGGGGNSRDIGGATDRVLGGQFTG